MIDRIGHQLRPIIKKNEENAKESPAGQQQNKDLSDSSLDLGKEGKEQEVSVTKEALLKMIEELNVHPYYLSKRITFHLVDSSDVKKFSIEVVQKDLKRPIQILKVEHFKRLFLSKTPSRGTLINLSC